MKRFKKGNLIWIIGAVGLIAVIGVVLIGHFTYSAEPHGYTPQEIEEMEIKPVNINTATAEELDALGALSETQIQNITAYREEHGGFASIEEILNVKGIGKKTYEKIALFITVE